MHGQPNTNLNFQKIGMNHHMYLHFFIWKLLHGYYECTSTLCKIMTFSLPIHDFTQISGSIKSTNEFSKKMEIWKRKNKKIILSIFISFIISYKII